MPARLSRIASAAQARGAQITTPKRGSHWKVSVPGGDARSYPIPAHKGKKTVIDDVYIRGLCRNFGWDLDEFTADL